jgi:hypothetical protein
MSRQQRDAIASPGARLTTVASRICLNVLNSARGRRERYVGGNMMLLQCTVNGQPGLVAQQDGVTVTVFAFEIAGDRIKRSGPYATRKNSAPGQ